LEPGYSGILTRDCRSQSARNHLERRLEWRETPDRAWDPRALDLSRG